MNKITHELCDRMFLLPFAILPLNKDTVYISHPSSHFLGCLSLCIPDNKDTTAVKSEARRGGAKHVDKSISTLELKKDNIVLHEYHAAVSSPSTKAPLLHLRRRLFCGPLRSVHRSFVESGWRKGR